MIEKRIKEWENRQRMAYKKGKLSLIQVQKLREAGFRLEPIKTSVQHKCELFDLAKEGSPKPKTGSSLRNQFKNYTNPNNGCYDKEFHQKIMSLRPDWFIDTAKIRKDKLLEMAKNGDVRPPYGTDLGNALCRYTSKIQNAKDPLFTKEIKRMRPDWFKDTVKENKLKIIEMARSGKEKPLRGKHPMGRPLLCYASDRHASTFDQSFRDKIMELRPDWFRKEYPE